MSAEQLEESLMKLPRDERLRFARWLYEHEEDILKSANDSVHPTAEAEILRRCKEIEANPERLEAWEGTTERVRSRLHELRRQKAGTL